MADELNLELDETRSSAAGDPVVAHSSGTTLANFC